MTQYPSMTTENQVTAGLVGSGDLLGLLGRLAVAEKLTTQGEWRLREMGDDCFVERPKLPGQPYGVEILGDEDYPTKRADAEFIVLAKQIALLCPNTNAQPAAEAPGGKHST